MPVFSGLVLSVLVALGACTAAPLPAPRPNPAPPDGSLLTVQHWQSEFDREASGVDRLSRPLSNSADSWDFYSLAYSVDAFTSMLEATGGARYADTALDYVENMMATARPSRTLGDDAFGDDYLGWVSQQPGVRGEEVPLYESYCWRYVARLLRVLEASPLLDDASFRARYQRVLAFTETHIAEKWLTRGAASFVYRDRTHMAAHWAYIALDLAAVTTSQQRRVGYEEIVRNIDDGLPNHPSSLRGQLRPHPTDPEAYTWSDIWGDTASVQDIGHGNGVIAYVVEARDLRAGWSADELAQFSRTLTAFVIGVEGRYPGNVDGTGEGNGWIADGFVKLGRYDPAVQGVLEDYEVQNAQYFAAMAVSAAILAARSER